MKNDIKIIKEEHLWTSEEKLKWMGYGEWVEEVDVIHIEYKGYSAYIIRILKQEQCAKEETYFGGHFCGYVKIPSDHPFFKDKEKCWDLDCHGGITFNEFHEEHLIGFDCAHSGDRVPAMEHRHRTDPELTEIFPLPEGFEKFELFNPTYRNIDYCINECINLIDHLIIGQKKEKSDEK